MAKSTFYFPQASQQQLSAQGGFEWLAALEQMLVLAELASLFCSLPEPSLEGKKHKVTVDLLSDRCFPGLPKYDKSILNRLHFFFVGLIRSNV